MKTTKCLLILCVLSSLLLGTSCSSGSIFEGAQDVGDVKISGSMSFDRATQTYTLNAAGLNLWGEADAFFMTWKKVSGDFSMRADIAFEGTGVNEHRKMGIIIREELTGGSRYADIAVHGDGLTSLQYRPIEDGITEEVVSENKAPNRIYLERKGNKILVKTGHNNLPETYDAEIELQLPKECYVGLFMCSHEDLIMETGYFTNVGFKKL